MQFTIATVLGLAVMAAALPSENMERRTTKAECGSQNNVVACCSNAGGLLGLGLLNCVNVISE